MIRLTKLYHGQRGDEPQHIWLNQDFIVSIERARHPNPTADFTRVELTTGTVVQVLEDIDYVLAEQRYGALAEVAA